MNQELSFKKHKKNHNSLFLSLNSNAFTLIELLVVIAIVAIMGTILVLIFTNTLLGSNKAQILAVIKQNGQAVLENMDKTIRDADNLVCPPTIAHPKNLVVASGGIYTRYRFIDPSPAASPTTNGLIQRDNPAKETDRDTGQEETSRAFVDRVCPVTNPMPVTTTSILTDINTQTGVSVNNGSFIRSRQSGFKDSVTVSFTLDNGVDAPPVIADQIDPVSFQTTIQLR